ncbi:hypothetical protein BDY19DRAFT_888247 [Irpex rosettiformis]|uniref:Uncharacterized protein n=1 Tax=Irpex rosettiformis TaxID=378272 RepID=A0ACB8U7M6_9APHY|nr:hypothetical protein BDY19DRAFT_888247 [Irpex rosettiformis]
MPPIHEVALLTLPQAHALAGFCASSYVGILYLLQQTRITYSSESAEGQAKERARRRDDSDVIRARLIAVSISTIVSCSVVVGTIWHTSGNEPLSSAASFAATLLGFTTHWHIFLSCLIAPVLYAGPLYTSFLSSSLPFQQFWSFESNVKPIFSTWVGWRNCIVAPLTEEVVFRACVLAIYHLAGVSSKKLIFLSPLWFGLAHVHHGWEVYHRLGRTAQAVQTAVVSVVFQLAYTTLFGFHCAYLFLKTGSLVPALVSHIFCNIMGLPGFGSDVAQFPHRRVAIILAYVGGMLGYIYTLSAWTKGFDSPYWLSM